MHEVPRQVKKGLRLSTACVALYYTIYQMKSVVIYGSESNHEIHEIHEKSFGKTANLHTWEMAEVDQKT